jgi:Protein of unknown function (DUF2752).
MPSITAERRGQRSARSAERAVQLVFFFLCLSPLAASLFLSTDGTLSTFHLFGLSLPFRNLCLFRLLTGYRCPVCGMTRCFIYMIHGDPADAWRMSHAGIAVFSLCVYETLYRLFRAVFGKFPHYRLFKGIETALAGVTSAAVAFFFIAQFFITL